MKILFWVVLAALQGFFPFLVREEEACALQTGNYLYESLDDEKLAGISEELPESIQVIADDNGAKRTVELTDAQEIEAAVQLFMEIQIGERTDLYVTDRYHSISFTFEDGEKTVIRLNDKNLEWKNGELYELEGIGFFWESIFRD
ncbi:MAG: hypothetical protein Q4F41_07780 [Eubacteriales bacterium]|nr:hypothetical protein [Eubacteriales bacterium]